MNYTKKGLITLQIAVMFFGIFFTTQSAEAKINRDAVVKVLKVENFFVTDKRFPGDANFGLGHGSGTIISEDGIVLTAKHVVDNARLLFIVLPGQDYKYYPAEVAYVDPDHDIAYLVAKGSFENYIELEDEEPSTDIGDEMTAIGYPLTMVCNDMPNVTQGTITSYSNDILIYDAPVTHGNSGGPIFDDDDEIIGIVRSGLPNDDVKLNHAVRADLIIKAYNKAKLNGKFAQVQNRFNEYDSKVTELLNLLGKYWLDYRCGKERKLPDDIDSKNYKALKEFIDENNDDAEIYGSYLTDVYNIVLYQMWINFLSTLYDNDIEFDENAAWYVKYVEKYGEERADKVLKYFFSIMKYADFVYSWDNSSSKVKKIRYEGRNYYFDSFIRRMQLLHYSFVDLSCEEKGQLIKLLRTQEEVLPVMNKAIQYILDNK